LQCSENGRVVTIDFHVDSNDWNVVLNHICVLDMYEFVNKHNALKELGKSARELVSVWFVGA
jgi:hypothetical protein